MRYEIPRKQEAVQLVGPDELVLNRDKEVFQPGPYQILARIEAVGLCFSDLKLLKQFSGHARKSKVVAGLAPEVLDEIPGYVPGDMPTVPGHEAVVEVCAVGEKVKNARPRERYLVQTDYRWVKTENSNAAFGYNFEGALQEYVLMDERIITSPEGVSMLIPASDEQSAAAIALVEPWACVEDAYSVIERTTLDAGGEMLVVAEDEVDIVAFGDLLDRYGYPGNLCWVSKLEIPHLSRVAVRELGELSELDGEAVFDDVLYFGSDPRVVEELMSKVAARGLLNIVLGGGKLGRDVVTQVGRVHYGGIRIIGTVGSDPAEAMTAIPATGEIRPGNRINIVGAAGPMGAMHAIRNICQGVDGVSVFAGDLDDVRLEVLNKVAKPLSVKYHVPYRAYNPTKETLDEEFDYVVLMAPVPKLVAAAITTGAEGAIINIFAGIPATVTGTMNLQNYIEKKMYFIGTSGSTLDDMKTVLAKVESNQLDTNLSVAAVSGLDGAIEGIRAVEKQLIAGKIIVYPACKGLGLIRLEELPEKLPEVAELLKDGVWNQAAEKELISIYSGKKD